MHDGGFISSRNRNFHSADITLKSSLNVHTFLRITLWKFHRLARVDQTSPMLLSEGGQIAPAGLQLQHTAAKNPLNSLTASIKGIFASGRLASVVFGVCMNTLKCVFSKGKTVMANLVCRDGEYNSTLKRCCGSCNKVKSSGTPELTGGFVVILHASFGGQAESYYSMVERSTCIQDRNKDCARNCSAGYFINWDRSPPQCATCNKCYKGEKLVEVQSCSLYTEAICRCQDGYYCRSSLGNTCTRCERHRECPLGQGVKTKGTAEKDTECEACPPGTYSNIMSATEKCNLHTDCTKLQEKTLRNGDSKTDTVCETSGHAPPHSEKNDGPLESVRSEDHAGTIPSAVQRYTTHRDHTVHHNPPTSTAPLATISTKDDNGIQGTWNGGYIVAVIICILILLIALVMTLKQRLCRLKLWIKKKTHFIQPKQNQNRMVLTYQEDGIEQNLLQRQNSARSLLVTLEPYQKMEGGQTERVAEDKPEMQQGRDHLNNRIEKIYIMNADTVLVGSISDVPSRSQRSVAVESEEKESLVLASRYPEQESSKTPGRDLMFSIEEEESEGPTAKVILQG
ncbi:tumor necrosis factor receptor superfamily member 8-like [Mantella aurantiaca]